MKYSLSKFTKTINHDSGDIIIYNTYTGKQSYIFDESIKEQLRRLRLSPQEEKYVDKRLIENFCVPFDTDENMLVYNKISEYINSSECLTLILFPTLDCNFKCSYCYENKEKGFMSDDTIEKIYLAIVQHYADVRFKFLKLEWFGGEPLLGFDKMLYLTKKVNNFCSEKGIIFQHSITTNGYLLTNDCVKKLLDNKIEIFQITVDGMPETHDKYRVLRDNKPTWGTIINNIIEMKKLSRVFKVIVRINYNYEILDTIEEFLNFYQINIGDDERFELAFKPIGHWGGENDDLVDVVPLEYHSYILDQLLDMCKNKGILSTIHFNFSCGSELCYANKKNSFVIYKNGNIGKCTLEEMPDRESDFVIGDVDDGYFKINEEKEKKWLLDDKDYIEYLNSNSCFECIAYPFCCGTSCPAHRVRNGLKSKVKCSPTKSNVENIVCLNYEMSKSR